MLVCIDCNFELCANAIIGCNQHRIGETCRFEIEEATKTTNFAICAGTTRGANKWLDLVDHQIAGIDIDTRFSISQSIFSGGVIFRGHHLLLKLA